LWAAFPSLIGPFPPDGATPGSVSMRARTQARGFATPTSPRAPATRSWLPSAPTPRPLPRSHCRPESARRSP
jgi:hypothetical protein